MVFLLSWFRKARVDSLYISIDKMLTGSVEIIIPRITEFHSLSCIEERDIFVASALPQTLDMSAWLSLVGSPFIDASVAQTITVIRATEREIIAAFPSLPKSAMPYRVFATVGEMIAIIVAPKKLHIPASINADLGRSARVDTQPAIALGASVQPFTTAKHSTRRENKIFIKIYPPLCLLSKEYDFQSLFNNFFEKIYFLD